MDTLVPAPPLVVVDAAAPSGESLPAGDPLTTGLLDPALESRSRLRRLWSSASEDEDTGLGLGRGLGWRCCCCCCCCVLALAALLRSSLPSLILPYLSVWPGSTLMPPLLLSCCCCCCCLMPLPFEQEDARR